LLLDGAECSRFTARILEDISMSSFARLELVIYNADAERRPMRRSALPIRLFRVLRDSKVRRLLSYALYSKLDEKRSRIGDDPVASVDCRPLLSGVKSIEAKPVVKGFTHRFSPEDLENIRGEQLDVLLRFGFNILRGEILQAARYGVWSFHHGDNDYYRGGPAYFWELYERNVLSGAMLQRLTEELDAGLVLCKSLFATTPGLSVARNRYGPYWGSTHFVIRKLQELHQCGWEYVESRSVPPAPYRGRRRVYKRPTNVEMLRWLAPIIPKKAVSRLVRRERMPHWRLAIRAGGPALYRRGSVPDMRGFSWIESPMGHFYADPFLVARGGRTWLFFEDFVYAESRGVISCAEVLPNGSLGPVQRSLERDYHLSYPLVFEHGGEMFMVPESGRNGTIELYCASEFPYRWKLEKVLHRLNAVDTTVWREDGRWWFFTTVFESPGDCVTLLLFHADSLTGDWTYHPANPIHTDVRRARGAGAIFSAGGHRFRPSQDSSKRYGYSFTLNAIVTLTPEEYTERPLLTVDPSWHPGLVGTHSYAQSEDVEVVDGCALVRPASVKHPTSTTLRPRRTLA